MTRAAHAVAGHGPLLEPAVAWATITEAIVPLAERDVPVADAAGRVLAVPARCVTDLPPFDRSAMDGFALRATEAHGALTLAGDVAAGGGAPAPLAAGTAVRISTGAPLPPGADAVLRLEAADLAGGVLRAAEPVPEGRFVRLRGEDVRAGEVVVPAGTTLGVQHLIALSSAGVGAVRVRDRPVVRILVNGDELQVPGTPPRPGAVFESNGLALEHLARRGGATPLRGDIVGDDAVRVRVAVADALEGADVVLVSGGMSVGPHDHVKAAFRACGVQEVFWRVAVKPGKPLWFGRRDRTLVFGLPGNPLSSLVGFLLFVEPALRRLQGDATATDRRVPGRLAVAAAPEDSRTTLLGATFARAADGVLEATPTERQGSHMTGALGVSDGFVILRRDAGPLGPGDPVDLLPLGDAA